MAIALIDERGRLTLPKETGIRKGRAVVIPAGSFIVIVPLPKEPQAEAGAWLPSKRSRKELKILAEKLAAEDAVKRAKRRRQL